MGKHLVLVCGGDCIRFEQRALDLYLRFALRCNNTQTKDTLFTVTDEEKAHLRSLGGLLEEKI